MVICLFVGCMCEPCKRKRSPAKIPQFRKPIGNSKILCRALRELFPAWSLANGQALRSWVLSMPASIRGRLDLLPEEYLRQFCAAHNRLVVSGVSHSNLLFTIVHSIANCYFIINMSVNIISQLNKETKRKQKKYI